MNEQMMAAMTDELQKIAGWGGLLSGARKFFGGAVKGFGQLGSKAGRAGLLEQAKDLPGRLSTAYQHGGLAGAGRAALRSAPVQMAGGLGAAYLGGKAFTAPFRNRQQPQ